MWETCGLTYLQPRELPLKLPEVMVVSVMYSFCLKPLALLFFFFKLTTSLSYSMSLTSDKKYTIILIVFSRKTEAFIPFGWFEDLLFITIFKSFDVPVPWHRFLCVSFQSVLGSLDMWLYTFSLVWKILAISSSYIFLSHLLLLPIGEYNYIFSSPMKNAIILHIRPLINDPFISLLPLFFIFFHFFLLVGG